MTTTETVADPQGATEGTAGPTGGQRVPRKRPVRYPVQHKTNFDPITNRALGELAKAWDVPEAKISRDGTKQFIAQHHPRYRAWLNSIGVNTGNQE